jgi:hypothetical protein
VLYRASVTDAKASARNQTRRICHSRQKKPCHEGTGGRAVKHLAGEEEVTLPGSAPSRRDLDAATSFDYVAPMSSGVQFTRPIWPSGAGAAVGFLLDEVKRICPISHGPFAAVHKGGFFSVDTIIRSVPTNLRSKGME